MVIKTGTVMLKISPMEATRGRREDISGYRKENGSQGSMSFWYLTSRGMGARWREGSWDHLL